tara:strand:- start:750 stop:1034 length:285 start_codon:yes stop_codon:yes gene_type:complete
MNLKDARKLQPGAIVREAWFPESKVQGIVLSKQHVIKEHMAKMLCRKKKERFDVTVHWLGPARTIPRKKWGDNDPARVQVRENWELMIISHAPL